MALLITDVKVILPYLPNVSQTMSCRVCEKQFLLDINKAELLLWISFNDNYMNIIIVWHIIFIRGCRKVLDPIKKPGKWYIVRFWEVGQAKNFSAPSHPRQLY